MSLQAIFFNFKTVGDPLRSKLLSGDSLISPEGCPCPVKSASWRLACASEWLAHWGEDFSAAEQKWLLNSSPMRNTTHGRLVLHFATCIIAGSENVLCVLDTISKKLQGIYRRFLGNCIKHAQVPFVNYKERSLDVHGRPTFG